MRDEVRAVLEPAVAYRFESGGHFPYIVRPKLYTVILEEQLGLVPARLDPLGQCRGARAMIVLSHEDVAALLPPATAIEVVARAMAATSRGEAELPLRSIMDVGGPNKMGHHAGHDAHSGVPRDQAGQPLSR